MTFERILIVGLGSIGQRHATLLRELCPEAEIKALRHKEGSNEAGVDGCFTKIKDALAYQPQIAIIANPSPFHLEAAFPLAETGVHLFIEKPLSSETRDVQRLISLCEEKNVVLMTGYNLRFLSSLIAFRENLQNRTIGKVMSVRAEVGQYLPSWRPDKDYRETVSAQKKLGGGVLLELSHEIDYLCWLFGSVESVYAELSKQSDLEIDVEDTAHMVLKFSNNIVATLNMDFLRHDTTRCCTVVGEKGTLRWDAIKNTVSLYKAGENEWNELSNSPSERNFTYREELKCFMQSIAGGQKPLITGEDGLTVLEVIEASRKASKTGQAVNIKNTFASFRT